MSFRLGGGLVAALKHMKLLSPVFAKEMVTLARRKRHYFARALVLGALLTAVGLAWSQQAQAMARYGFADLSAAGRSLYSFFMFTQVAAAILLMPGLAAPVVAVEKERKTLGLLLMSNLSPQNILLDKLLSRLALFGLLLLAGAPLMLVCLAFGGVTPIEIALGYAGVLGVMLFCCGVGLYFSTVNQSSHTAMIATYAVVAVFVVVGGHAASSSGWLGGLLVLAAGLLVFVVSRMSCSRILPTVAQREKRSAMRRLFRKLNAFFHRINFTGVVIMDESRSLKGNAMLWKEAHNHFFSSTTFLIRSFYALLMVSMAAFALFLLAPSNVHCESTSRLIALGCLLLVFVIAVIASSTAFSLEREKHSMELLMSTPLTAGVIVIAKFVGVMRLTVPLMIIAAAWLVAGDATSYRGAGTAWLIEIVWLGLVYAGPVALIVAIGLYSSAMRRTAGAAILQTTLICAAWSGVGPLVRLVTGSAFRSYGYGSYHPYSSGGWQMFITHLYYGSPGGVVSVIMDFSSYAGEEQGYGMVSFAVLVIIWLLLIGMLVRSFDRIVGRA